MSEGGTTLAVQQAPGITETAHAVGNVGSGTAAELATYFVEKGKPFIVVVD